jgi:hypothetical protein
MLRPNHPLPTRPSTAEALRRPNQSQGDKNAQMDHNGIAYGVADGLRQHGCERPVARRNRYCERATNATASAANCCSSDRCAGNPNVTINGHTQSDARSIANGGSDVANQPSR